MKNTYNNSYNNESKTSSSMTLQSSAIYVPTGVPIEDWLTSLRQASPASHIPMQENERDQKIVVTSGLIPSDALAKWNQATQSWRTFQESFLMDTPALSQASFPKSGTVRNGILYPLPMPVRPTLERDGGVLPGMKATHHVPTPTASDHIRRKSTSSETLNYETNKSVSLDRWAERWMTPNTMDSLPPKSQKALDHEYTHRPNRSNPGNLRDQIAVAEGKSTWPTPRAREGTAGAPRSNGSAHNAGRGYLDGVVQEKWPTPTAMEAGKIGNRANYGQKGLSNHPAIVGLPDRDKMKKSENDGNNSGVAFRLNPAWVSWLMGVPTGWESLEPMGREAYNEWFEDMTNLIWWDTERDLPRVTEENNNRNKRLRSLGNGIVPASLALFIRDIMDHNSLQRTT